MRANIEEHRSILLKKIEELQNELKEAQQKLMSYEVEWNQQYPFLEHLESLEKEKILVHRLHSGSLFIGKGVNSFDSVSSNFRWYCFVGSKIGVESGISMHSRSF